VGRRRNPQHRVERLLSAWNKGSEGSTDEDGEADDPLVVVSAEPVRRGGTRLSDTQRDAVRTLYAEGASVNDLARQFQVHRSTIWRKVRAPHDEPLLVLSMWWVKNSLVERLGWT